MECKIPERVLLTEATTSICKKFSKVSHRCEAKMCGLSPCNFYVLSIYITTYNTRFVFKTKKYHNNTSAFDNKAYLQAKAPWAPSKRDSTLLKVFLLYMYLWNLMVWPFKLKVPKGTPILNCLFIFFVSVYWTTKLILQLCCYKNHHPPTPPNRGIFVQLNATPLWKFQFCSSYFLLTMSFKTVPFHYFIRER